MIEAGYTTGRHLNEVQLTAGLVIAGGGLAGVCGAITAARAGVKVILVQDRPVLGGNASSEVRLWVLGATSHLGNNNRWSREGGVIDELLTENMYRNPEGNPMVFDLLLLDKVNQEKNITLLLNTAVHALEKADDHRIAAIEAFCSQNSTAYRLSAPLFCDASGDGILGFLSGASFRMGAESREEFGELFAPDTAYGELLGHSLYFYSKDTGKPVKFTPPAFALADITEIPRFRSFNTKEYGCKLWWLEYGGRLDTVHDTEKIKWELWKVVYGAWNYIKNSGEFPEAENLTLEWVGMIPGKRESRRFMGDYLLKQQDIVEQRRHADAVGYGGWSIDLHPADGVFSEKPGCNQWHSKGIYQIPYRTLYSRDISNLFLAGRIISASHVAFGSSRVMATGALMAQAVAIAARICLELAIEPAEIYKRQLYPQLQQELLKIGHYIPGIMQKDGDDLVHAAKLQASSEFVLSGFPANGCRKLDNGLAQMLPLPKGTVPAMNVHLEATEPTEVEVTLRISRKSGGFTPEVVLEKIQLNLAKGRNCCQLNWQTSLSDDGYVFVTFARNPLAEIHISEQRITGILAVCNGINKAVSNYGKQSPPPGLGVDEFEFWCPERRPGGQNIALQVPGGIRAFAKENIRNGIDRPVLNPNAWVADPTDPNPVLTLSWEKPQTISRVELAFDTDFDHPMETVLMGHPETVMPFCVRHYRLLNEEGKVLFECGDNHHALQVIKLPQPEMIRSLRLELKHPSSSVPAALFAIRCFT